MKNLIINADDYGISDGVCKSINELYQCKAITSTSLMVASPNAIQTIKRNITFDLSKVAGVHLQLTSGYPLTPVLEIPSLINKTTNEFRDPRLGIPVNPVEVENEWKRQIETAIDITGNIPTHLDSHHGVHRIPELFEIYVKLANEYGIPMRGAVAGPVRENIKNKCINASIAIVREWTGKDLDAFALINHLNEIIIKESTENIIEIISHPGFSDSYLERKSSLNKARENDHEILKTLAEIDWWVKNGFNLVSYKQLINGFNRCN